MSDFRRGITKKITTYYFVEMQARVSEVGIKVVLVEAQATFLEVPIEEGGREPWRWW